MMAPQDELAGQCRMAALILWRELRDVWGHASIRIPGDYAYALATVRWQRGSVDEPVLFGDLDGRLRADGDGGEPVAPAELPIHAEIYRRHPGVGAVVHAHPHAAVALSAAGETVRAISQQSVRFGDGVPLAPGDFVDTREGGAAIAAMLEAGSALLQRGHGAITTGRSLGEAVTAMLYLEQTAQQLLWAAAAGGAQACPESWRRHPLHSGTGDTTLWRQLVAECERAAHPGA